MKIRTTSLLLLATLAMGSAEAATIYVDGARTDDSGAGTSWETAKKTIQAGIDVAEKNDTVLIAAGTYAISASLTIGENQHIALKGATGNRADVVVDAQGLCPCLVSLNQAQIIVSSMTFVNGRSTEASDVAGGITTTCKSLITNCVVRACYHGMVSTNVYGGGVYMTSSFQNPKNVADNWPKGLKYLPTITDTLVEGCAVYCEGTKNFSACGGGVYVRHHNSSDLTIQSCVVTNFSTASTASANQGGGAYFYSGVHERNTIRNCAMENPASLSTYLGMGGGVYFSGQASRDNRLLDSLIEGNRTHGCGAGVGIGGKVILSGCTVRGNETIHATGSSQYQPGGVGIYLNGDADGAVVENTLVENNISTNAANQAAMAGAVTVDDAQNVIIRSCVIRGNALQNAGALSCISAGGLLVTNCVMRENLALSQAGAIRFLTNQKSLGLCGRSFIVDCSIISNTTLTASDKILSGGILLYGGANANKSGYYAAPLTVRNCLIAGNRLEKGFKGWGIRATVGTADGVVLVDDELFVLDHCTIARNFCTQDQARFICCSGPEIADRMFVRGCAISENRDKSGDRLCGIYNDSGCVPMTTQCYSDVVNGAFTVTEDNGNVGSGEVKFVDAANLDFRLQKGSCLIDKGGAFADWMGTGRASSAQDMGAGSVIGAIGSYGVTVGRTSSNPRRYGAASDIGCCEYWQEPGTVLLLR